MNKHDKIIACKLLIKRYPMYTTLLNDIIKRYKTNRLGGV